MARRTETVEVITTDQRRRRWSVQEKAALVRRTYEAGMSVSLVPPQTGTGGRVRQLGISKRGDAYLRTLLMHGARSIIRSDQSRSLPWLSELLKRRPYSVVVAAVANKRARTIWAVLARGQEWRPEAWQAT